jgi:hypothetical protein
MSPRSLAKSFILFTVRRWLRPLEGEAKNPLQAQIDPAKLACRRDRQPGKVLRYRASVPVILDPGGSTREFLENFIIIQTQKVHALHPIA